MRFRISSFKGNLLEIRGINTEVTKVTVTQPASRKAVTLTYLFI